MIADMRNFLTGFQVTNVAFLTHECKICCNQISVEGIAQDFQF